MLRAIAFALASLLVSSAQAQQSSAARISLAQSRFSIELIRHVQTSNRATVVVSPAGAAAAIALLAVGANETFRESAHNTLGYDNNDNTDLDFKHFIEAITRVCEGNSGSSLSIASAAVFDKDLEPYPAAIEQMRKSGAEIWVRSLGDRSTVSSINEWVSSQTRGRIRGIIDSSIGDGGLLMLNALYFKDDWEAAFDKALTQSATFHGSDGTAVNVPMMEGTFTTAARFEGRYAGVTLNYKSSRFSLTLLTTRDSPANFSEFLNLESWLNESGFRTSRVEIHLPRFIMQQSLDLMRSLDATPLGGLLRDPATFLLISSKPVFLGAVLQKVYLEIDEQGSQAAAATAIFDRSMNATSNDTEVIQLDKPFVFALRDRMTGLFVLCGYVGRIPVETP